MMMYDYRGQTITECDGGVTVFYCGDEVWFKTEDDAKLFIDSVVIEERRNNNGNE